MSKFLQIALMTALIVSCSKFDKRDNLSVVDGENEKAAYKIELAVTDEEMKTGLMNREKLDQNSGMLFNLGRLDIQTAMWMKDTKIPLDMIFIDKDGMIFWIYENAEPESTKLIVSPYPAFAVLEVNAGDVKKFNIKIGDTVKHEWFKASAPSEETKTSADEPTVENDDVNNEDTPTTEDNKETAE